MHLSARESVFQNVPVARHANPCQAGASAKCLHNNLPYGRWRDLRQQDMLMAEYGVCAT